MEETMQCPFCGQTIKAGAKKCRFCGKWLSEDVEKTTFEDDKIETISCPNCGQRINAKAQKCKFCGRWLNNIKDFSSNNINLDILKDMVKNNKKIFALIIVFILVFIVIGFKFIMKNSTPSCETVVTKNQLIGIFKEKSNIYNHIISDSIKNIRVETPVALSYDKDINRYVCQAEIHVYSKPEGFRFEYGTFYEKFNEKYCIEYNSGWIEYTSQISEGKPVILSKTDYNSLYAGLKCDN